MPDYDFKRYLPDTVRSYIETKFYAQINAQADFERLIQDPDFLADPISHVGFYSDHGVVHVRDVTRQLFQILDTIHGVLIPERPHSRLNTFMKGYGEIVSYLHDIGMVNFSAAGRRLHPEFAAQWVYTPEFDNLLDIIWEENCGNIAWRLVGLANRRILAQEPKLVLREMFAMSCCHSKSRIPFDVLNSPDILRRTMQDIISMELSFPDLKLVHNQVARLYSDFPAQSFAWLNSGIHEVQVLVDDVIDTLRVLRCADALRQRGTVMKTSGNYEIFVDHATAHGIIALRKGDDQLFLVTVPKSLSSGEANIASSELGTDGNLRITFHRGAFASAAVVERAAEYVAAAIDDIQADVIGSFKRPEWAKNQSSVEKSSEDILILLEGVDDNVEFTHLIRDKLLALNPALQRHVCTVPSLEHSSPEERARYLTANALTYDHLKKQELLEKVAQSGHDVTGIHLDEGFQYIKMITLQAGETLIEAGSQSGFVYIPLGEGLRIIPLGGYQSFSVRGWMPLGNSGVIRGAVRNATVVADQALQLLMIPKEIYLKHWHHPYSIEQLLNQVSEISTL